MESSIQRTPSRRVLCMQSNWARVGVSVFFHHQDTHFLVDIQAALVTHKGHVYTFKDYDV